MKLIPPSTNADYDGSPLSAYFVTLLGLMFLITGGIHAFLPDGGAGVIANLDLSNNRDLIVGVFAWAGATQMAWGATLLVISLRYRVLVPLMLVAALVERCIAAGNMWIFKDSGQAKPPGAYGALVTLVLIVVFLALALYRTGERNSVERS